MSGWNLSLPLFLATSSPLAALLLVHDSSEVPLSGMKRVTFTFGVQGMRALSRASVKSSLSVPTSTVFSLRPNQSDVYNGAP